MLILPEIQKTSSTFDSILQHKQPDFSAQVEKHFRRYFQVVTGPPTLFDPFSRLEEKV